MKQITSLTGAIMVSMMSSKAETVFGGMDTKNVDNWTTSSLVFDDTVQSGHSLNWENVVVNNVTVDSLDNRFDLEWETATNYTIGHLFIYNGSYDLASEAGGIQGLLMTADFEASAFANWSPVVAVTDGGVTNYYRWNHSGNSWNGNGALDFSIGGDFDLSQLGNAPNTATAIWGKLNAAATGFGGTRTNGDNPNLQAATGTVQFGFIQWGASTGGSVANQNISTSIDSFEVVVNPGDATAPVVVTTPGTALSAVSISANGEVTDTGNETPNVTVYYGTTDGGTDVLAWDSIIDIGRQAGAFSATIEGLDSSTTYFYRPQATNSGGTVWADTTESVTTLAPSTPAVSVLPGSSDGAGALTMNGEVTDTGNEAPEITIFYGTTDGGTNPGSWDEVRFVGVEAGAFSVTVTGLEGDTTYFYRAFAENTGGAVFSETTESGTTNDFAGVPNSLDSSSFDFQYEMDENPSGQDLDSAGSASDWFLNPALGAGVDQQMWTPQTYSEDGIATSNQAAGTPEALFRSDFGGSISRESILGDFTVEVAVQLKAGTILSPEIDLGGFGMFLNPPALPAFRLNINEDELSTGMGDNVAPTGNNTGGLTLFRVAYVEADQRFWVWRNGVLIYGDTVSPGGGTEGSEPSLYAGGGFLLGDFAADLSGDWDIDYIRVHNEAVAPTNVIAGDLAVTGFGFVNDSTVFIDFVGESNRAYAIKSSSDLTGFTTSETPINGTTGTTDASGVGRVEINVTGRVIDQLFFRVENP